ncbi:MAG: hypothetical protein IIC12_06335 [Proteobacteria bacterium]|nr:hypothetical protein [Pseudomonadota bacterium]
MAKTIPYNQPTAKPGAKVNASGAGPIIAGLALGLLAAWKPDLFTKLPPGFELQLGLGLGGVIAWFAGYMRRERS